jgi:hypothetical protein
MQVRLLRAPALCLTHRCNDRSPQSAISTRQRPFHAFGTPGRQTSRDDDPRGSGGMGGFAASPGRLFVGEPLGKGPAPSPRRLAAASAGKNVSRGLRWERDTPAASGTFLLRLLAPLGSQSQARPRQFPRKQTGGTTRLITLSVVPCRPLGAPRGERLCARTRRVLHSLSGVVNASVRLLRRLGRPLKGEERVRGVRAWESRRLGANGSPLASRRTTPLPSVKGVSGGRADRLGESNLEKKCHLLTVLSYPGSRMCRKGEVAAARSGGACLGRAGHERVDAGGLLRPGGPQSSPIE